MRVNVETIALRKFIINCQCINIGAHNFHKCAWNFMIKLTHTRCVFHFVVHIIDLPKFDISDFIPFPNAIDVMRYSKSYCHIDFDIQCNISTYNFNFTIIFFFSIIAVVLWCIVTRTFGS